MAFDDNEFETTDDAPLPEESGNNRTFLIAVGILGGIILLSIACLVGVYLFGSQNRAAQQADAAAAATQTAQAADDFVASALTSTAQALEVQPTATLEPTATSVVNIATSTATPTPDSTAVAAAGDPAATATVGAALTQAAIAQLTVVPTSTLLPQTGLVEDVGVPGLIVMAIAFVVVILLARRLRTSPM